MKRFITELYQQDRDVPAIVVGGGPSAPEQILRAFAGLSRPAIMLSANGHACKLGYAPNFIVCKDHTHTETKEHMEKLLRPLGATIVARHPWADVRLSGQWPMQGNSGQLALSVAVLLGCRPIIAVGFDCYQNGTYFHDLAAKNVSSGLRESHWRSRYKRFSARLEGAPIRSMGGMLSAEYPPFDPAERLGAFHMPVALRPYETMPFYRVRAKREFGMRYDPNVLVAEGDEFPVDPAEVEFYLRTDCVELVDRAQGAMV